MILWFILTAMIVVAAVGLTIPLVRRYDARRGGVGNITVLKDQLSEIDARAGERAGRRLAREEALLLVDERWKISFDPGERRGQRQAVGPRVEARREVDDARDLADLDIALGLGLRRSRLSLEHRRRQHRRWQRLGIERRRGREWRGERREPRLHVRGRGLVRRRGGRRSSGGGGSLLRQRAGRGR